MILGYKLLMGVENAEFSLLHRIYGQLLLANHPNLPALADLPKSNPIVTLTTDNGNVVQNNISLSPASDTTTQLSITTIHRNNFSKIPTLFMQTYPHPDTGELCYRVPPEAMPKNDDTKALETVLCNITNTFRGAATTNFSASDPTQGSYSTAHLKVKDFWRHDSTTHGSYNQFLSMTFEKTDIPAIMKAIDERMTKIAKERGQDQASMPISPRLEIAKPVVAFKGL